MPVTLLKRPQFLTGGNFGSPKIDLGGCVLYAPLWRPDMVANGGAIVNGSGTMDVSPQALAVGANTITVTVAGTLIVNIPEGGTVASGTMTVTGSPVTVAAGIATTITTSGATGNITVTPSNIIRSKDRNNYPLTVTGTTWGSQGRTADGDDYIVASGAIYSPTNVSLCVWVNPSAVAVSTNGVICGRNSGIWIHSSLYRVFHSAVQLGTGVTATANQWDFLCARFAGLPVNPTVSINLNGGAFDSAASNQTEDFAAVGGIRLFVRSVANADPMSGTFGAAWVYIEKLLTVSETQSLMDKTKWRYQ